MTPYHQYTEQLTRLAGEVRRFPLGGFPPAERVKSSADAPRVLIFSPHPDDECVIGGVAVRLMREAGMRVVNVAVTQGSNSARQAERLVELRNACDYLGFDLVTTAPKGLEKINPKTRTSDPAFWERCVNIIHRILAEHQPRVVLFPHDADWNSTHIGTHLLVVDALRRMPADYTCTTVETEYWGQMATPNLMLELTAHDLGDMLAALSFHIGEVQRNPYHVLVPLWMMDNVRRAENVGGQGTAAPDFTFATLYRLRRWAQGQFRDAWSGGKFLARSQSPATLLA